MKGIQFVTDDRGEKTAVLIDLKEHAKIWEDFYDGLIAEQRKDEPRISWNDLKKQLNLGQASNA